jgi:UrcA family protein
MDDNSRSTRCLCFGLLFAAILSITMCFGSVALASDHSSIHVQLGDLDLTTPQGRRVANKRIRQAASEVCSRVADWDDVGRSIHVVKCINLTVANVFASMQSHPIHGQPSQVAKSQIP